MANKYYVVSNYNTDEGYIFKNKEDYENHCRLGDILLTNETAYSPKSLLSFNDDEIEEEHIECELIPEGDVVPYFKTPINLKNDKKLCFVSKFSLSHDNIVKNLHCHVVQFTTTSHDDIMDKSDFEIKANIKDKGFCKLINLDITDNYTDKVFINVSESKILNNEFSAKVVLFREFDSNYAKKLYDHIGVHLPKLADDCQKCSDEMIETYMTEIKLFKKVMSCNLIRINDVIDKVLHDLEKQ